jgi:MFS family permease
VSFGKVSDLLGKQYYLNWGIIAFMAISVISIVGQYLILAFIKQNSIELRNKAIALHLKTIHNVVTIAQYVLTLLLLILIYQITLTSHYNVLLLTVSVTISYGLSAVILSLVSQHFFSWWRSNRNLVLLLYSISSASLAFNAIFSVFYMDELLIERPPEVWADSFNYFAPFTQGSFRYMLDIIYIFSSILCFILTWGSTLFLLHHFSNRLGRIKFWFIISIPLVYFISQFITPFVNSLNPIINSDPFFFGVLFTLVFTLSKLAGGILFGIAFWTVAKTLHKTSTIRAYMIISAYGMILVFITAQATITQTPYPAFGAATVCFVGLSSYMMLVGIYSSAISVSQDATLRRSIQRSVENQSKLLHGIGTAQMEQEIQKTVLKIANKQADKIKEETGIETSSSEEI